MGPEHVIVDTLPALTSTIPSNSRPGSVSLCVGKRDIIWKHSLLGRTLIVSEWWVEFEPKQKKTEWPWLPWERLSVTLVDGRGDLGGSDSPRCIDVEPILSPNSFPVSSAPGGLGHVRLLGAKGRGGEQHTGYLLQGIFWPCLSLGRQPRPVWDQNWQSTEGESWQSTEDGSVWVPVQPSHNFFSFSNGTTHNNSCQHL